MSDAKAAVAAIRAKTKYQPIVAIVLGSGLGALADDAPRPVMPVSSSSERSRANPWR